MPHREEAVEVLRVGVQTKIVVLLHGLVDVLRQGLPRGVPVADAAAQEHLTAEALQRQLARDRSSIGSDIVDAARDPDRPLCGLMEGLDRRSSR